MNVEKVIKRCIYILDEDYLLHVNSIRYFRQIETEKGEWLLADLARAGSKEVGLRKFYLEQFAIGKSNISTQIDLEKKYGI